MDSSVNSLLDSCKGVQPIASHLAARTAETKVGYEISVEISMS